MKISREEESDMTQLRVFQGFGWLFLGAGSTLAWSLPKLYPPTPKIQKRTKKF